jgi:predicted signal transduction protein with EAL and GGDEF domain
MNSSASTWLGVRESTCTSVNPVTDWLAKTVLWFGVFITIVFAIEAALLYVLDRRETVQRLDRALSQLAPKLGPDVARNDVPALQRSLEHQLQAHALSSAAVYSASATLMAQATSFRADESLAGRWVRAVLPQTMIVATQSTPIHVDGKQLGRLELRLDSADFASAVGLLLLSATLSFFLLTWLVARIVHRVRSALRAPAEVMARLSEQVTVAGNFEYRIPALVSYDGFGFEKTVDEFLEALNGRERKHEALSRRLYAELAQRAADIAAQGRELQSLAYTSAETQLPNRQALTARVRLICARQPLAPGRSIAFFLCHVSKVKHVNEAFGFDAGALLVQFAARRFGEMSPQFSELFHLGGADFAVVVEADSHHMAQVAEKLMGADDEPFVHGGATSRMKTRIGYALFPDDAANADDLCRFAPLALGEALNTKTLPAIVRFKAEFLLSSISRESLEDAIRDALDQHQIEPFFQPRIDALSGCVSGLEAFVRWKSQALLGHDNQELIAIAERSLLISDIDSLMLRKVSAWMGSLVREGIRVPIALNVSAYTLERVDYVEHLMGTLREFDVDHRLIELELTETVLIDGNAVVNANLNKLQQLGIKILLDDFGAGYSSLRYLHDLPISIVKIDKAFVQGLPGDEASRTIIESTLDLCRRLGKRTVAEGVETAEQLAYLRAVGCDEVQGYYLMRPMSSMHTREALLKHFDPLTGCMSMVAR